MGQVFCPIYVSKNTGLFKKDFMPTNSNTIHKKDVQETAVRISQLLPHFAYEYAP